MSAIWIGFASNGDAGPRIMYLVCPQECNNVKQQQLQNTTIKRVVLEISIQDTLQLFVSL
jgi:hypothetical protein